MKSVIVLLLFFLPFASLKAGTVSGWVTDEEGSPLPFATILVQHTTQGVTTNSEGFFTLSLNPGIYSLECRYVGYTTVVKKVTVGNGTHELNFTLEIQQLQLDEVIIDPNAEDPAYEIIRNAIRQRPYYNGQVNAFSADVYVKGMMKLLELPDKILGKKIEEDERREMDLDSAGQGIVYLAESVTRVSVQRPDRVKMEVRSNRVSGSDGFGFDFPIFINFYENVVNVSQGTFSKRGFVSPIADNALNFYHYKFLGSFFEHGTQVHTIRVTPRRRFEPLFSGTINITDGDWRIFSSRLFVTNESQLQILDSLIITQIHARELRDIWRIKNQVIHFHAKQLGIAVEGDFVNVYSNYDLNPQFEKGFFDRTVIRYDTAANKRPESYWDTIRPVPLEKQEVRDFERKDSMKAVRDSVVYNPDSLRKLQRPPKVMDFLLWDVNRNLYAKKGLATVTLEGLLKGTQYNTVEGLSINPSLVISKYVPGIKSTVQAIADVRYGFNNERLNPWAGLVFSDKMNPRNTNRFTNYKVYLAGGRRVSQFFKLSSLTGLANSVSTLLYGWNEMKLYENDFVKGGFQKTWDNGLGFVVEGVFENRIPLSNTTDFLLNNKWKSRLTPNYPQVLDEQFPAHKALVFHASFRFQPGQRYIQYPNVRYSLGSKYPEFIAHYYKGAPTLFGSSVDFDRWQLDVKDVVKMNLAGRLLYNMSLGGFLNDRQVYIQDFKHYYGTHSHISDEYVKAFQYTDAYQYSNAAPFYAELHFEHHADGLITNKLPLLKKWNWHLVEGMNALYISPEQHHLELFIGLENIFKVLRVDLLMRLQDGYKPALTYRIGFGGLIGDALNARRFVRHEKIISAW